MLVTFDCHINVECAVSFSSVKYINKYMCKGQDHASMAVDSCDKIRQFVDGRYLFAPESVWRIFQFHIHEQSPSITCLQIPGQHLVMFDPNENPETVLERAADEHTTLTAFFNVNADPIFKSKHGDTCTNTSELTLHSAPSKKEIELRLLEEGNACNAAPSCRSVATWISTGLAIEEAQIALLIKV
jgi:hypothetical protein